MQCYANANAKKKNLRVKQNKNCLVMNKYKSNHNVNTVNW